ncbi:DUF4097 family beta strand repeat-containing protein [Gemmatimonas aurantiaca]|uniref:DUF4097 family beta strand repeat-containing protein n=1 Tax=Gemmatimonas aurantiaca TaxID=173480 RepID=UPI00301DE3D7
MSMFSPFPTFDMFSSPVPMSARSRIASRLTTGVLALALIGMAAPAHAQDSRRENAFTWSGTIPSGRQLFIKNINGGIDVERSSSGRVEVTAEKQWRRGNPEQVRIEQKRSGDNVVICALWNEESTCDEDGIRSRRSSRHSDRNDVSVHFTVRVPEGVRVNLSTVNGGIEVNGVTSEVVATTVNGSLRARSAGGPVRATTVNGSIYVAMGSVGSAEELEYTTVNGAITIELPDNFGAQFDLSTVNGRVNTDFPITVSGTLSSRRLRGTVGNGHTRLRASTVNGAITLRRLN